MNKGKTIKDVLVVGFALFAMFFGAGNLIFPPYLGFGSAANWFQGFMCFILTDVGLSILAILVIAKFTNGAEGITEVLGKKLSTVLLAANAICLGPLIAIPRTAATTFEFAVQPLFPFINSWVASILFFAVVIILSIKPSKVMDIVGAVLSPIMLLALAFLIFKGVTQPLGIPGTGAAVKSVVREGIKAGYQTMDMMGAIILSVAVVTSIVQRGYTAAKSKFKMIALAGVVSAVGLFSVYCGLAYLGASVSTVFPTTLSQAELLIAITSGLLGKGGVILLGVIVFAACLTTAIGLLSSCATYFSGLSKGKVKYETLVIVMAIISCGISNFGISTIISLAAPILELIYPVLVVLIFLRVFSEWIKTDLVYRWAAGGAFVISVLSLIETYSKMNLGISRMPLHEYGFPWVVPAIICGFLGLIIEKLKNKKSAELKK